jgi:hypothetical protein
MNKINWSAVSVLLAILIVVIGWGVSVEIRISSHASIESVSDEQKKLETRISNRQIAEDTRDAAADARMSNLEKLLVPIIVDYRVRKELEAAKALNRSIKTPEVNKEAKKWADEEIQRGRGMQQR